VIKFLVLLLIPFLLNAKVILNVPNSFLDGEPVRFSIEASGSNVNFPDIKEIDGFIVQKVGTSQNTTIINGKRDQKIIRTYQFFPSSTIIIPSFTLKIDDKIEKTKERKVNRNQIRKTKSKDFDLEISVNKNSAYVGEDIELTLIFKYKKNIQLYDLRFTTPTFDNFWSKQLSVNSQPKDNLYVVQKLKFLLFPQKDGVLKIPSFKIDVVLPDYSKPNNFFGPAKKIKKIYSNSLDINVNPLPNNIHLIGNFKIKTTIDKSTIKVGESVSFQLEIQGRGNIDDLEEYKIDIPNVTIYDNKSKKDFNIKGGKYGGVYKKSYSIVADQDFTIPPLVLKYFDKNTKQIKIIKSKEYQIKVKGTPKIRRQLEVKDNIPTDTVKTKTITKIIKTSDNDKILYFGFGFILASVLFSIYINFKNKIKKQVILPLENEIKSIKTTNELLKKIVPYINIDTKLNKLIFQLESNNASDFKQIKKEILTLIKELKI